MSCEFYFQRIGSCTFGYFIWQVIVYIVELVTLRAVHLYSRYQYTIHVDVKRTTFVTSKKR